MRRAMPARPDSNRHDNAGVNIADQRRMVAHGEFEETPRTGLGVTANVGYPSPALRPSLRLVIAVLVFVAGSSPALLAQGRATLNGVVLGPAGAPQPNVTLIVTNAQ